MAAEHLSPAAFAAHRGVNRSQVSRWIGAGKIAAKAIEGSGRAMRINVALADAALDRTLDAGQQLARSLKAATPDPRAPADRAPPAPVIDPVASLDDEPDGSEPDYSREKARLAKAQADAQEMKNGLARKELVPAADAERDWSLAMSAFRSRMLAVPKRVRDWFPQLDTRDVAKVDEEIRAALTELSRAGFLG